MVRRRRRRLPSLAVTLSNQALRKTGSFLYTLLRFYSPVFKLKVLTCTKNCCLQCRIRSNFIYMKSN